MSDSNEAFGELVKVALGYVKDKALCECIRRIETANRELLVVEAEGRRKKSNEIIKAIQKMDIEILKFERTFNPLKSELSPEAVKSVEDILSNLKKSVKLLLVIKTTNHLGWHVRQKALRRVFMAFHYVGVIL